MEDKQSYRIWHTINGNDPEYQKVRCPATGKRMIRVLLNRDLVDHKEDVKFGVEVYVEDGWEEVLYDGKTIAEIVQEESNAN